MLWEWLLFTLKGITVAVFVVIVVGMIVMIVKTSRELEIPSGELKVTDLRGRRQDNDKLMQQALGESINQRGDEAKKLKPKAREKLYKENAKALEQQRHALILKRRESGIFCPENIFVLSFHGGVKASEVKDLRREISAVLDAARPGDEVIVDLESPGGMVNSYGLCAAELMRVRESGVYLTVCVDQVAASGGYMMAAVANRIVAAPFAYIGSIGVIAQIPNFHRLMNRYDIDYEQITAGKYKRTVTMFGENTQADRDKLKEELEAIHARFKEEVQTFRPMLNMEELATGEYWLAKDALQRGLVDEIATFSDYLSRRMLASSGSVLKVKWCRRRKNTLSGKLRKLVSVRTWVRILRTELLERDTGHDQVRIG
ncbi:MAG: protease SohB [Succinivibrio sp.]|nr:protease SohB [Succinivibrio sp.]